MLRSFWLWVFNCKDVCQQPNIVGRKIVVNSGLKPATFGLQTFLLSQLQKMYVHTLYITLHYHIILCASYQRGWVFLWNFFLKSSWIVIQSLITLVWDRIRIFNFFVCCFYRKGQALRKTYGKIGPPASRHWKLAWKKRWKHVNNFHWFCSGYCWIYW